MRVLIADKDKALNQGLAFFIRSKKAVVDSVYSAEDAEELARLYEYDVIISGLLFSDRSGTELLKRLRNGGINTPFIVLSAVSSVAKKIECFDLGADDYILRPCDKNELLARVRAVVRRSRGYAHALVKVGEMTLNLDTKVVKVADKILHLTGKEYALLELLALRKGMIVSKEQFLNHLYGGTDEEPEMKIIDVFLCRIRTKIKRLSGGKDYVQTVWGRGYILKDEK
jgi:two-component system cell cycle response regulator CtrA